MVGDLMADLRWLANHANEYPELFEKALKRIEMLETALQKIASLGFWDGDSAIGIARKALEGKKDE